MAACSQLWQQLVNQDQFARRLNQQAEQFLGSKLMGGTASLGIFQNLLLSTLNHYKTEQ